LTCTEHMILTSNGCQKCGLYEIGGPNTSCISCPRSPACSDTCFFLESCFSCPQDKFYSLDLNTCVDACQSYEISLNDENYGNFKFCRSLEYFVDSSSGSSVELGNWKHPYKSLNAAFVEIYNLLSNRPLDVTISVMENTTNFIKQNSIKIVKLGSINFRTYSNSNINPSRAAIRKTANITLPDPRSKFYIPLNMSLKPFSSLNLSSTMLSKV